MANLILPQMRRDQWKIYKHPAKTKVLSMGRCWGKTVLGGNLGLVTSSVGMKVAWVVPTYKNGRALWKFAEQATGNVVQAKQCTVNKSDRMVEFDNGGFLGIFSADSPDSMRGWDFDLAILDEAARISQDAWQDVIQPTLADRDGQAVLISTPNGLNWFYEEWIRGQLMTDQIASWTAPTKDNPNPNIQKAARLAQFRVPHRTFIQEWLAQFVGDGAYFQNVDKAATILEPDLPEQHAGHFLVMSADFGRSEDFTVICVGCLDCNKVVDWDRFNQIDYTFQREKIYAMHRRWGTSGLLPERNSIGEPNIEIIREHVPIILGADGVLGFNTLPSTKPSLIQHFATAIEHEHFLIPTAAAMEVRAYEEHTMDSGHHQYSAPDGQHDDWVMSLALLWKAMHSGGAMAEAWLREVNDQPEGIIKAMQMPERGTWDRPTRY